jgi:hypothetical protein
MSVYDSHNNSRMDFLGRNRRDAKANAGAALIAFSAEWFPPRFWTPRFWFWILVFGTQQQNRAVLSSDSVVGYQNQKRIEVTSLSQ